MDRAERRQRRLEQKVRRVERPRRGRGRGGYRLQASEASNCESKDQPERFKCSYCPGFQAGPAGSNSLCNTCGVKWNRKGCVGGRQDDSLEDGTDGVTVYEGEMSLKDVQAQLHLSDAKGLKWQKIAAERLEENKELRTEIQCLNQKIKEITDAKAVRHIQFELRLRAEIQSLKERNDELTKSLDSWVKHHSSIHSSEMKNLTQIVQNANGNKQSSHYQVSQGTGNAGRYAHETIAEVDDCTEDQNNSHRESSKQTGNFERNGCESAAELNLDVEQRNSGYPQRQTQHSRGNDSKSAEQQMHLDRTPNERLLKTQRVDYVEKSVHGSKADVTIDIGDESSEDDASIPVGLQKAPTFGILGPAGIPSEDVASFLFTEAERRSALTLVNKEFFMWLNSRTRRPTPKEMSFHKSQVMQRSWPPGQEAFNWTGLPGRLLLSRFHADTAMEKPSYHALSTLLRSVLHVEGSKRADDMLWCLVWADCVNPSQLPGYTNYTHDIKRTRATDDEIGTKSSKVWQS